MDGAILARRAELGVETEAAASVAIQRAHGIAFYMRRGRLLGYLRARRLGEWAHC